MLLPKLPVKKKNNNSTDEITIAIENMYFKE